MTPCPNCGKVPEPHHKFCTGCGSSLLVESHPVTVSSQTVEKPPGPSAPAPALNHAAFNLGLVVHCSKPSLEFIGAALSVIFSKLKPKDRCSVVLSTRGGARLVLASDRTHRPSAQGQALREVANASGPDRGCGLVPGVRAAIEEVSKGVGPSNFSRVLVVTDVNCPDDIECIRFVGGNGGRISFSTVGLGVEFNEKFLMHIARAGHGAYHFVGDPREVLGALEDEVRALALSRH